MIECSGKFNVLYRSPAEDIVDVRWLDGREYAILFEVGFTFGEYRLPLSVSLQDRVDVYHLQRVDANNDAIQDHRTMDARYL